MRRTRRVEITKDTHRKILEMVAQNIPHRQIAGTLGIGVGTVSEYRHRPLTDGDDESKEHLSQVNEICGDKWSIVLPKTRICTLEQLVEHCKVDLSTWEVERFIVNKWEQASNIRGVTPLFQVKAFLRKKAAVAAARKEIEELKKLAKQQISASPAKAKVVGGVSGNMLELNIPDAHFGKLAWAVETGGANYDSKIAYEVYMSAIEKLLVRVQGYKFDEILFVVGNDMLNSDDIESRTTKGTSVTTDGRYHKTFAVVRRALITVINRLRQIAPVRIIMVSGNHDSLSVWHLGDSIECYFHDCSDVVIDNTPRYRKYHQFGNVMLMFTHGDKGKRADYPLLMATEQPKMFGMTKFREAHTGHTHMTKVDEQHGVRVRVLPALCPADDWHAENGFVGNIASAEAFVWNKDEGLIGTVIANSILE